MHLLSSYQELRGSCDYYLQPAATLHLLTMSLDVELLLALE